jgi:RES domain-containing protein
MPRAQDLSGMGAHKNGGRWNSKGTYMLYTGMNSSLAYLENLVHFDESDLPPNLYITSIEIKNDMLQDGLIYELPDAEYPDLWQVQGNLENKIADDQWILENKFLAFKVRSAINPSEFNFLLNPLYPGYHDKVTVNSIKKLNIDVRLIR